MSRIVPHGVSRREFVSHLVGAAAVLTPVSWPGRCVQVGRTGPAPRARSTIVLWMSGGPSTIDIWDLKPGTATGGPFRPVRTSGEGQICEHLPMLARQMHHLAVIRSMSTRETDHEGGCRDMRTGYEPHLADSSDVHLAREPRALRQRYGEHEFGRGCLRARQLVEQQIPLVEVRFCGWDSHHHVFSTLKDRQLPVMDCAMSALIEDLDQRGLLPHTLIVWMGEFGRTPRINGDGGRDHWARSWSVVLGGAGIRGGTVVGQTSADGTQVISDPVNWLDVLATVRRVQGTPFESHPIGHGGRRGDVASRGTVIDAVLV